MQKDYPTEHRTHHSLRHNATHDDGRKDSQVDYPTPNATGVVESSCLSFPPTQLLYKKLKKCVNKDVKRLRDSFKAITSQS